MIELCLEYPTQRQKMASSGFDEVKISFPPVPSALMSSTARGKGVWGKQDVDLAPNTSSRTRFAVGFLGSSRPRQIIRLELASSLSSGGRLKPTSELVAARNL